MSSPTSRTLDWLRKQGMEAGVVEKWIPQTRQRKDLFGFIDIVALDASPGCLGVQATSGSNNAAARRTKVLSLHAAHLWLKSGNRIWVVGWSMKVKPGSKPVKGTRKRPKVWTPTVAIITLEHFE